MVRWASRFTVEVTAVRVERVQEISEGDCEAEGLDREQDGFEQDDVSAHLYLRPAFHKLWDSLNPKNKWDKNPHCWVCGLKKVTT